MFKALKKLINSFDSADDKRKAADWMRENVQSVHAQVTISEFQYSVFKNQQEIDMFVLRDLSRKMAAEIAKHIVVNKTHISGNVEFHAEIGVVGDDLLSDGYQAALDKIAKAKP